MGKQRQRDPAVPPMVGSAWWLQSETTAISDDPETATLIIRLQLALNALDVQGESAPWIAAELPEGSPVRMRSLVLALMSYAAYIKESINILTGTKDALGEFQRVYRLARRNDVPPQVVKKVRRICSGAHPACAAVTKMRNQLGFHWDPRAIRPALLEFSNNESVIWVESCRSDPRPVHRLAIDVATLAAFPEPRNSASMTAEQRIAHSQKRISRAINDVADAGQAIARFFHHAVVGYLKTVGAERKAAPQS